MEVDAVHTSQRSFRMNFHGHVHRLPLSLNAFNKTELRPTPAKTAVRPRGFVQWMEGLAVELIKR